MRIHLLKNDNSNFSDLMVEINHQLPLRFDVRSYMKIALTRSELANPILSPVKMFLKSIEEDNRLGLYSMYREVHQILLYSLKYRVYSRNTCVNKIEHVIRETFVQHNLVDQLVKFCQTNSDIVKGYPNLSEAGSREHDTHRRTFGLEEYQEMTAICLLCKLMIPIWGLADRCLQEENISRYDISSIQYSFIEKLLGSEEIADVNTRFQEIIKAYFEKFIVKRDIDVDSILERSDFTRDKFINHIRDIMFVKRMPTFLPLISKTDEKRPNIMVYVDNGIKHGIDIQLGMMRYGNFRK